MRTNDNCCCYNNGHKHWFHYLLFEFVLQKMQKHLCVGRPLGSKITPLLSAFLTFLALPQSTCMINVELLIKDNGAYCLRVCKAPPMFCYYPTYSHPILQMN